MLSAGDYLAQVKIIPRNDIAHIMHTVATTGVPKEVIHTHHNVVTVTLSCIATNTGIKPEIDEEVINA